MTSSATSTAHKHESHAHDHTDCLNCGHTAEGNFCSHCGQTTHTHAVDWHYIWHEIPHSVWHLDRGILFTLRELCTRPGYTIRDFLAGKRVNHYRPLAMLLILGAVLAFVSHSLNVSLIQSGQEVFGATNAESSARVKSFQEQLMHFLERNQTVVYIVTIPIYAFSYWFVFRRRGYNYPQILVAQTFTTNFSMLVAILITLVFWVFGGTATAYKTVTGLSILVSIGYMVITYIQLFRDKLSTGAIVARTLAGFVLGYISFLVLAGLIGLFAGIYIAMKDDSGAKKTMKQPAQTVQQAPH